MKSVFFRRLLATLTVCMLLASAVLVGGYTYLVQDAYADIKLEEMQAKAALLRQLVIERAKGEMGDEAFKRLAVSFMEAADAAILVMDAQGRLSYVGAEEGYPGEAAVQEALSAMIADILSGCSVARGDVEVRGAGRMLVAAVPVEDQGGVLLMKKAGEVTLASRRLSILLLWVALVVVPLSLLATVLRIKRETSPLHAMSEAAISMCKGDFSLRLDEEEPGEVGVLSRALNNLCETLSGTIYQLRFEKGQLDEILQSLTDGVAAFDGSGALTHCNSALMRMFGAVNAQKREDISEDGELWSAFDEVFESGQAQTITYPLPGERTLWITVSPVINEDGSRNGVVGLFKDMTEMERLEDTRREYVANVSHELRTPLTAVRGLLEPLADGMVRDEETRQRYYHIMLHEVLRLSRLITDMMTLSRLQSGAEYVDISRVDIHELLSDVVSGYTAAAEQKGIRLTLDARQAVDGLTDPDRIEQVLVILLDNALRFTPEGGTITIRVQAGGERMLISVEDTGTGIPQEDLPHIFERFYKVDKSRGSAGTGLGLSIAKFIIDKLDEHITVGSEIGKGTCFTFTVKRYVSNAIALGPATESRPTGRDGRAQQAEIRADEWGAVDADYVVVPEGATKKKARAEKKPAKQPTAKKGEAGRKRKE